MIAKIPIVIPSNERKVRNLFSVNEPIANRKLSLIKLKNIFSNVLFLNDVRVLFLNPSNINYGIKKSMKKYLLSLLVLHAFLNASAQTEAKKDTSVSTKLSLKEVTIAANKTEQNLQVVPNQIQILKGDEISAMQAQTTADVLSNTGNVFVQKSQMGGGSPVLRGFEANRILLVIDGVRMNNLIYRGGHLQNVITLDNNILERIEIIFGPSSTIYGSDALGGTIHFFTKTPTFSIDESTRVNSTAFFRYGSVNNETTFHADLSLAKKRFASLTSFTHNDFGDLMGGKNKNPFYKQSYGERLFFVQRINGKDSTVKNPNKFKQIQSGYQQIDILQKFIFKQNDKVTHTFNFQYSNSSDVPRYDRLTEMSGNNLRFAEWYYGPQARLLASYKLQWKNATSFFQEINLITNYQKITETRHTRRFGNDNLSNRIENVNVAGINLDLIRKIKQHEIRTGIDAQHNTLRSTANQKNILTGNETPLDTRYPDGNNTMNSIAAYFSHTYKISDRLYLSDGVRAGFVQLKSNLVDTNFYRFPFNSITQNNPVFSGNVGITYNLPKDAKFSGLFSTGFRVPNIDDLAKIFESTSGTVIVPNNELKPEQTYNLEVGFAKIFAKRMKWENTIYYTQFKNAITTSSFKYNGQDSILYDGEMSKVLANQNQQNAYLYGASSSFKAAISSKLTASFVINYSYGRIKTDTTDAPLDHIPPLMGRFQLQYNSKKLALDFFVNYNGFKKTKDYNLNGEDNFKYATPEGMPAWFTLNLRGSYKIHPLVMVQAGIDNILDTQYRTFSSGINGAGRNIFVALRANF